MKIKSFVQIKNLEHKTVLVRVDFNVPIEQGKVREDFKIKTSLPLIQKLVKAKAKIILITHLGDPAVSASGKIKISDKNKYSVEPIAKKLGQLMKRKIKFSVLNIGGQALQKQIKLMKGGEIICLENIRFYPGETKNNKIFAKQLGALADVYINNAFAVSHREHASVAVIKKYLPAYAGPLLIEEVVNLSKILRPARPLVAIIGGSKIDTKVNLVKRLETKANHLIVGGALASNFLAAKGYQVGKSLVTAKGIKIAKKLLRKNIVLPVDVVVQNQKTGAVAIKLVTDLNTNDMILDIGTESMKEFGVIIKKAQTLIWNGPMGKYEEPKFRFGTFFIARAVASRSSGKAFGVVGGGETVDAINLSNSYDQMDWVSTGGGASLSFLAGEKMPGLKGLVK